MPSGNQKLLKIGDIAKFTGTTLRTIRYYDEMGIVSPKVRTKGGFRLYSEVEVQMVQLIRNLQLLDFPLSEIKNMFDRRRDAATGDEAAPRILEVLRRQLEETESRIARYQHMRRAIRETMEILEECAGCRNRPTKTTCLRCDNILSREDLPLPVRVLMSSA